MLRKTKNRATAIIYKNNKLLIFRRVKPGAEYYVFPGGGVHDEETIEQALVREVREELSLDVLEHQYLFTIEDLKIKNSAINYPRNPQDHHYYLVRDFHGVPELGGPEKESANADNQYHIEWFTFDELAAKEMIYPRDIAKTLKGHIMCVKV